MIGQQNSPVNTGKGFDQDQVAKLRDACSIRNAQQIPAIWSIIQVTKGMSFDTYRAHISKSIDAWCHSHYIDRDKSIFLESNFLKTWRYGLTRGGQWLNTNWWCKVCQCWHAALSRQARLNIVETTRRQRQSQPTVAAWTTYSSGTVGRWWHQRPITWI